MDIPSSYSRLIELLTLAKGDRSWNQYALNSGVDSGHISKIRNNHLKSPPKPNILSKLAQKAHNGVTYNDLMEAAGYLNSGKNDSFIKYEFETIDKENLPQELKEIDPDMAIQMVANNNGLSVDDIKSIIEAAKKIKANTEGRK